MELGVLDTCFIINWARFRLREDIKRIFRRVVLVEPVLGEVKDTAAITLIGEWLAANYATIYPLTSDLEAHARRLVEISITLGFAPIIDFPEAYALVVSLELGGVLVTDTKAPKRLSELVSRGVRRLVEVLRDFPYDLGSSRIMDAVDVLLRIYGKERLLEVADMYTRDTGIVFSRRRLRDALEGRQRTG